MNSTGTSTNFWDVADELGSCTSLTRLTYNKLAPAVNLELQGGTDLIYNRFASCYYSLAANLTTNPTTALYLMLLRPKDVSNLSFPYIT